MTTTDLYAGRLLTISQLPSDIEEQAEILPAFSSERGSYRCNRCASMVLPEQTLPTGQLYCRGCIVFGRLTNKDKLYYFPQKPFPKMQCLSWSGELTTYQAEVSKGLLEGLASVQDLLVHAVTGAGKTEMIYPVVSKVIDEGGSVCLASPRIDVCLELYQRLSRDFSCKVTCLHGDSDPYTRSPLLIATTHQLLKFYHAFDLLIIDEVDAFPFVDNPILYHALEQAIKPSGIKIFLTATSTDALDEKVALGQLKKLHLARRFHANPLVVPRPTWLPSIATCLKRQKLPKRLLSFIRAQRCTGFPLLLFYPDIEQGIVFTRLLQSYCPEESVAFVSSKTADRHQLVSDFRQGKITILVSTTILERGVTFPCVDVFVLEANHRLYTKSALVQIAGRVGRSADRPTGELLFFHDGMTRGIQKAIAEIKEMNQKGGFT